MRSLEQALTDHELIVLRVIGEWWELDLTGGQKLDCVRALAETLAALEMAQEVGFLPPEEATALQDLVGQGGRVPVATFSRSHGEVRQMGPGRMEREEPWLEPASPAEALFYRGFLYRGFDDTPEGVIEFYYLPEELQRQMAPARLPTAVRETAVAPLQTAVQPQTVQEGLTDAVDDLTTLLALTQRTALRQDTLQTLEKFLLVGDATRRSLLLTLAQEMGMVRQIDNGLRPTRTAVAWLEQNRENQLRALVEAWSSSGWNDLGHIPGLICEGEGWHNDPILPRTTLLDYFPRLDDWYLLATLQEVIKANEPDFQRPDGNYDTWYIRNTGSSTYLSGFENWEQVEGRLIVHLVEGPLYWLGMVELGRDETGQRLYRPLPRLLAWLERQPVAAEEVQVPLVVQADGVVQVPYNANRYQRFQVARIGDAQPVEPGKPYAYQLTPGSLTVANEQGITAERVLQFLESASGRPLPPSVRRAVVRWAEKGVEGQLETAVVLRVRDPAILDTLRSNPKTRDYIGEALGDYAVMVRRKDWQTLRQLTAQLGLLLDIKVDE